MARKKKVPVTPVTPQKAETQPAQVIPQSSQKDASSSSQVFSEVKPATTTPKP